MHYLALDIGKRRTGMAFVSEETAVPVALDTVEHRTVQELVQSVALRSQEKGVHTVLCGLPLLPSGEEGEQCRYVRSVAVALQKCGLSVLFLDERYSTPQGSDFDGDAFAACQLLLTFLDQQKR
ncbi:hypothetical protein COU76_01070 [Candidatus Peregrinibacteria bacterium CG10_big_fil_rev_8_21_14_0_10_49_10]|nr:MAG: hypothetical protein COU76_01070 [Candidatus Peregrinibacteria bacterium CG10_big_fil_rev_8_21_14_0_10_49_10]